MAESNSSKNSVKVICVGDSAVGKSKLVERFLLDKLYDKPKTHSTYAVTIFNYDVEIDDQSVSVELWDTAGQERFNTLHPSYYLQAHACVMVFDVTRKTTYKNLSHWYDELRENRPNIPCLLVANKIDTDYSITQRKFNFAKKNKLPLYYVSASDGTNVVKVFRDAAKAALAYKEQSQDLLDQIMEELHAIQDKPTNREEEEEEKENEKEEGDGNGEEGEKN